MFVGMNMQSGLKLVADKLQHQPELSESIRSFVQWVNDSPEVLSAMRDSGIEWEQAVNPESDKQPLPSPLPEDKLADREAIRQMIADPGGMERINRSEHLNSKSPGTVLAKIGGKYVEVEPKSVNGPSDHPQSTVMCQIVGDNRTFVVRLSDVIPHERNKMRELMLRVGSSRMDGFEFMGRAIAERRNVEFKRIFPQKHESKS